MLLVMQRFSTSHIETVLEKGEPFPGFSRVLGIIQGFTTSYILILMKKKKKTLHGEPLRVSLEVPSVIFNPSSRM